MESIRRDYLVEKYKDFLPEESDRQEFAHALDEASDHAFSHVLDIDLSHKKLNKEILIAAAKAEPDVQAEIPNNYHKDIHKTISFYDKYKKEVSKPNLENFKSAVYYVPDEAYESVEKLELKDKKKTLLLSALLGVFGAGSIYLGNYKRAAFQIVINVLLVALIVLVSFTHVLALTLVVTACVLIAIAFRWCSEVDTCMYYVNVINGQKIIDTLRDYRRNCKAE